MDDLEFLPRVTGEAVVVAIQRVALAVGNIRGRGPGGGAAGFLEDYLAWTETAELELGNVLGTESVDTLIRTAGYWSLRGLDGGSPSLIQSVSRECDRQRRRLDAARQQLRAEMVRWKQVQANLVVPDTNIFLDKEPFETINWPALFDAHITRIIVPIVVIHELDRLKRQGNQATSLSARHALRWLKDVLPTSPGAKSVNLTPGPLTTVIEVYVDQGPMRRNDADGDIIAFTQRVASLSELPTTLATRDLGMQLRAGGAGVEALQLVDVPRLTQAAPDR